jgi:hypothetical protein
VDVNSGHSSLANVIIQDYLKDESPKSPVYIYALNNENKVHIDKSLSEEEMTNLHMRQKLMDLN